MIGLCFTLTFGMVMTDCNHGASRRKCSCLKLPCFHPVTRRCSDLHGSRTRACCCWLMSTSEGRTDGYCCCQSFCTSDNFIFGETTFCYCSNRQNQHEELKKIHSLYIVVNYLKMAFDMRYANSFHAHQLKNSLWSCFCMHEKRKRDQHAKYY